MLSKARQHFTCCGGQTAIGHWGEMMFPLYSILRREDHFAQPPSQFVLLHLKRAHLMEWVRSVVAAALGTRAGADLPRLLMQQETPSVWNQTCAGLPWGVLGKRVFVS